MLVVYVLVLGVAGAAVARASMQPVSPPVEHVAAAVPSVVTNGIPPAPPADGPLPLVEHLPAAEAAPAPEDAPAAGAPAPDSPGPTVDGLDPVQLAAAPERLAAFTGLSTWIDTYDEIPPRRQVELAAAAGVQTIFFQSARYNSPTDIHDPERMAAVIDAAKELGLKVMVWYIPDHVDPAVDLRRSRAAIAFTTPTGNRADAFGLDIEMEAVTDVSLRTQNLLAVSAALRTWVGPEYPMAAIVLPPLQLERRQDWWPGFPYAALRPFYDVYIPMSYSSYRGRDHETTYAWNYRNIVDMRALVGDAELPVHLAGGIADGLPAVDAFVAAAADGRVIGAGLYDLETTRPDAWPQLRRLRTP